MTYLGESLDVPPVIQAQDSLYEHMIELIINRNDRMPTYRLGDEVNFSQILSVSTVFALFHKRYRNALQLGGAIAEALLRVAIKPEGAIE